MSISSIRKTRKNILITLLCLIIIAAHPNKVSYPIVNLVWPYLNMVGLDVYMKPFTGDMIFMYDSELKESIYTYDLNLTYFTQTDTKTIDVRDLSFHRFRVPFTWFGIAASQNENLTPYISTLCKELSQTFGTGHQFRINSDAPPSVSKKYHMNKPINCPTHE